MSKKHTNSSKAARTNTAVVEAQKLVAGELAGTPEDMATAVLLLAGPNSHDVALEALETAAQIEEELKVDELAPPADMVVVDTTSDQPVIVSKDVELMFDLRAMTPAWFEIVHPVTKTQSWIKRSAVVSYNVTEAGMLWVTVSRKLAVRRGFVAAPAKKAA